MVDHIYCINLERSPDRRLRAQAEFEREGLDVEFFRGTDGKAEAPEGLFITKSEWGCADSHIRVWRDIVNNGYESALVFEDDISLAPDFNEKLEQIMSELPPDWDHVNLGATNELSINLKKFSEHLMIGQALNAHAYIIHNRCARKWSDFQPKYLKSQFDGFITNYPSNNFHSTRPIALQKGTTVIGGVTSRTFDWSFHIHRWGAIVIFLLFLFLIRNIIMQN
jgi:GR25 family glycosyltransferase involved in LPS biosynthesis